MQARKSILLLSALCFALVAGIFAWQISALPNLRVQIKAGLRSGLESIAQDAAQQLDAAFAEAITAGSAELKSLVPSPASFASGAKEAVKK